MEITETTHLKVFQNQFTIEVNPKVNKENVYIRFKEGNLDGIQQK